MFKNLKLIFNKTNKDIIVLEFVRAFIAGFNVKNALA